MWHAFDLSLWPDGPQPTAYRVTVTQVGSAAAAQGGGDVFNLADVLHVGARHGLQNGLVAPLLEVALNSRIVHIDPGKRPCFRTLILANAHAMAYDNKDNAPLNFHLPLLPVLRLTSVQSMRQVHLRDSVV